MYFCRHCKAVAYQSTYGDGNEQKLYCALCDIDTTFLEDFHDTNDFVEAESYEQFINGNRQERLF